MPSGGFSVLLLQPTSAACRKPGRPEPQLEKAKVADPAAPLCTVNNLTFNYFNRTVCQTFI